jgi:hypothetical protein
MATRTILSLMSTVVVLGIVAACGGGQPPAESPEVTPEPSEASPPPATEPSDGSDAGADTHTMPDGTTMPGSEHGEGTREHGGHQH